MNFKSLKDIELQQRTIEIKRLKSLLSDSQELTYSKLIAKDKTIKKLKLTIKKMLPAVERDLDRMLETGKPERIVFEDIFFGGERLLHKFPEFEIK